MTLVSGFEKIVREQEPLSERTWLKLGGVASFYAEPHSVDELAALVRRCCEEEVPIRVLGGGSNVLIRDEGVAGMVISLTSSVFSEIQINGGRLTGPRDQRDGAIWAGWFGTAGWHPRHRGRGTSRQLRQPRR